METLLAIVLFSVVGIASILIPNGLSTQEQADIDLEIKRARARRKYQSRKERGY